MQLLDSFSEGVLCHYPTFIRHDCPLWLFERVYSPQLHIFNKVNLLETLKLV